jgi:Mlc titration factor MtfA (ptsG expression regulator)
VHDWDEVLAGESMEGGPVMVNWHDVAQAGASAATGFNVVIHEFVHKIDLRDGAPDGCPPLRSREARRRWLELMQREYARFREQVTIAERFGGEMPWLDSYGATAIDEFFAVACEAYFVNRPRFTQDFPGLTALFDGFYLQAMSSRA